MLQNQIKKKQDAKSLDDSQKLAVNIDKKSTNVENRPKTHRHKIIWKRMHVSPSIPAGNSAFGYQESKNGELVARKPQKVKNIREPNFVYSFAEFAKYKGKGFSFPEKSTRLEFKILDNPAPSSYNGPVINESDLGSSNRTGIMSLTPAARTFDHVLNTALRQSIPGPSSYDVKPEIEIELQKKKGRISFGRSKRETAYLNNTQLESPAPGNYNPIKPEMRRKIKVRGTFGSTTQRFRGVGDHIVVAPPIGVYDIEEVNSLYKQVEKKTKLTKSRTENPGGFGTGGDRFPTRKHSIGPGPAAYDISQQGLEEPEARAKGSLQTLIKRGPVRFVIGETSLNPTDARVPIFGTQSDRFSDKVAFLPPPGTYDLLSEFERLRMKSVNPSGTFGISDVRERPLFKVKELLPGPGDYDPIEKDKKTIVPIPGPFLTSKERFTTPTSEVPPPNIYDAHTANSLIKKSFNSTLGNWPVQKQFLAE